VRRTRAHKLSLLIGTVVATAVGAAWAQTLPSPAVELHQFHGSPFFDRTLQLDEPAVLPPGKVNLGLDADDAFRPLVVKDDAGVTTPLVRHAVGAALRVSVGVTDRLELGALVPAIVYQAGETLPNVDPPSRAGLEAVRAGLKVRLLGGGQGAGLGLSVLAAIPTGTAGGLIHEHGVGGEANLFGAYRAGDLTLAVGAGARYRKATTLYDVALGNELSVRAAADYQFGLLASLFAEVDAATALAHPWASSAASPLELLGGGRVHVGGTDLFLAAGPGLSDGYGTPIVRVVAGGSWSNAPRDRDEDGVPDDADRCPLVPEDRDGFEDDDGCPDPDNDKDGIPDAADRCPNEPEDKDGFEDSDGCPDPDNDKDGIPDVKDKCPNEPETKNGYKDDDGCPDKNLNEIDTDNDGITDDVDKCPTEPEDKDGFEDDDGCPDPDNDKDGIPDAKDKCPNEPETINGVEDDDGCPDKGLVVLKENELETLKPIFFSTDRARVHHEFFPTLDAIAAILIAHPDIGRCAIEGHTDATGPKDWNQKLSLARAQAVAAYLTSKGVDPSRLVPIGQGDALPWASNKTEAGRAANRRVIFHVEGVSEEMEKKEIELQRQRTLKQKGADEAPPAPTKAEPPKAEPANAEPANAPAKK
jgi:outer membrane protein OmpA-like peptidoglycan-associated protein